MMLSREPTEEMRSEPFLRGFMGNAAICSGSGKVVMPSPRTLLTGSFSTRWCTETAGKDGESNAGCELRHCSVKADEYIIIVLNQQNNYDFFI